MTDQPQPTLSESLTQDASLLGDFFRDLKREGIPAAIAGHIVADLYRRVRFVQVTSDDD